MGEGEVLVSKGTFSVTIDGTPRMFRRGETLIEDTHPWFKGALDRAQFGPVRENLTYPNPAAATAKTPTPTPAKTETTPEPPKVEKPSATAPKPPEKARPARRTGRRGR